MNTNTSLQLEVEKFVKVHKILKRDFAEMIGVSPVMLSHWLKGRVNFKRSTLEKIISVIDKECL